MLQLLIQQWMLLVIIIGHIHGALHKFLIIFLYTDCYYMHKDSELIGFKSDALTSANFQRFIGYYNQHLLLIITV
jgi:hypothetical protein